MKNSIYAFLILIATPVFASTLEERLAGFGKEQELHARFVETWSASYLDQPLVSKGRLTYKAPGQLGKYIEDPEKVTQLIDGDQLSIERNGEKHTVQLSSQPELAAGIYALRDVLEGNLNGLTTRFETKYIEEKSNWRVELKPKDKSTAKRVDNIVLSGKDNRINNVKITYRNSSSLVTEIIHEP